MACSATHDSQEEPPQRLSQLPTCSVYSVASQEILQALMDQVHALTQRVEAMALQQSATSAGLRPPHEV